MQRKEFDIELPEEGDWLKTCHKASEVAHDASFALRDVANRLSYTMGDALPVQELLYHAKMLFLHAEALDRAVSSHVFQESRQAAEQSGLLLKATIAGAIGLGTCTSEQATELQKLANAIGPARVE